MQNFSLSRNHALENILLFKKDFEKSYCEMVQNIIKSKPFGHHKFYIFQFVKRVDDVSGVKSMKHQARLTKPEPVAGSTLLRCDPNKNDQVDIIWTLPNQENFGLYNYGKAFGDPFVHECVKKFLHNPSDLMKKEEGDLSDEEIRDVYKSIYRMSK